MDVFSASRYILHEGFAPNAMQEALGADYHVQDFEPERGPVELLDTFDGHLRRAGHLLWQSPRRVFLLTADAGRIHAQSRPAAWRFAAELDDGPVRRTLLDVSSVRAFVPVLAAAMQQGARFHVRDDNEKIHIKGWLYEQEQNGRTCTLVLLAPLRGYYDAHRVLQEALRQHGARCLPPGSDLYAELGVTEPLYDGKPLIPLDAEAPAIETACLIMRTFIQVARRNEAGIIADLDTEFLHDYRVSLRKTRSLLSLCKTVFQPDEARRLQRALADLMKPTNRLRDLDVYLFEQSRYRSAVPNELGEGVELMFAAFAEERQQQLARVTAMLQSAAYADALERVLAAAAEPGEVAPGPQAQTRTGHFARRLIGKRYHKVCRVADRITAHSPDEAVHALRIQCKKLRYAMEFFAPLFPTSQIKQRIKDLKQLQDTLGRFNDYAVQQRSLHEFLETSRSHPQAVTLAGGVGALMTVLHQGQQHEREQVFDRLTRFGSAEIRAAFADLVAEEGTSP